MSESKRLAWKQQVEEKAMRTAIMYVLEDGGAASAAERKRASHTKSDRIYGLFALIMGIAMAFVAAGFYAVSEVTVAGIPVATAGYGALGLILFVSGIYNLLK